MTQALAEGTITLQLSTTDKAFINQKLSFLNVFNVQIMKPNRANMGENKMFMALLPKDSDFERPFYLALQNTTGKLSNAAFILSEATYNSFKSTVAISSTSSARILSSSVSSVPSALSDSEFEGGGRLLQETSTAAGSSEAVECR